MIIAVYIFLASFLEKYVKERKYHNSSSEKGFVGNFACDLEGFNIPACSYYTANESVFLPHLYSRITSRFHVILDKMCDRTNQINKVPPHPRFMQHQMP
jgi:hypothetical protein